MKASQKNIRISPKKANLVAGLVRGKQVTEALNQLKFTPKKAADILYKLISSAVSNATTNFAQDEDKLYVKEIIVNKGVTYKRGIPVSRGRYHRILKRNSNISVEVGFMESPTPSSDKEEPKKAEKAEKETVTTEEKAKAPSKKTTAKKPAAKKSSTKKTDPKAKSE